MTSAVLVPGSPAPSGPFSQALVRGNIVALSGQVGMDPRTREYVSDDVPGQTRQALANLRAVLEGAGASIADVITVRVFVTKEEHIKLVNEPYKEVFAEPYPARTAVVVGLPGRMLVEIDAIAVKV
ncbi:reactive intermediate/imine deaminase [Spongiactinospora gelatinilytica]|uniref:Reactive intermediate/imine deaminase n=1 Tax=Spongiactinospora gelatinilytica TaxID=2666298 RepID=A0A2W2FIN1_9ACTN|nr:Rid family hydrolase [Spongiactinospora gelatinilytica]PZG37116.1 reactive intermediate/imine deaminase [Spongiactinospora gelatinilytica]